MLTRTRYDSGELLSDRMIRDDLVTLVLAGHETTATTLAWMIDLLLHHDAALARVCAEAQSGETSYTEAVINETLLLRPPAPITGRMTTGPYRQGDHDSRTHPDCAPARPGKSELKSYPDPDAFRPERFRRPPPPILDSVRRRDQAPYRRQLFNVRIDHRASHDFVARRPRPSELSAGKPALLRGARADSQPRHRIIFQA